MLFLVPAALAHPAALPHAHADHTALALVALWATAAVAWMLASRRAA